MPQSKQHKLIKDVIKLVNDYKKDKSVKVTTIKCVNKAGSHNIKVGYYKDHTIISLI